MKTLVYIIISSSLFVNAQPSAPPEGAFKNLDKVQKRYSEDHEENSKNVDEGEHAEYIWMTSISPRVKEDYNSFTSDEIERIWANYRNGKERDRALGFSLIASIEESSKWLSELKQLIKSNSEKEQMLAFSVLEAYARNDYGRFKEKAIFEDAEILNAVGKYTEVYEGKDKYFRRRVQKIQNYVSMIRDEPEVTGRSQKVLPFDAFDTYENTKNAFIDIFGAEKVVIYERKKDLIIGVVEDFNNERFLLIKVLSWDGEISVKVNNQKVELEDIILDEKKAEIYGRHIETEQQKETENRELRYDVSLGGWVKHNGSQKLSMEVDLVSPEKLQFRIVYIPESGWSLETLPKK